MYINVMGRKKRMHAKSSSWGCILWLMGTVWSLDKLLIEGHNSLQFSFLNEKKNIFLLMEEKE